VLFSPSPPSDPMAADLGELAGERLVEVGTPLVYLTGGK